MHPVELLRALRGRGLRPAALLGSWGGFTAVVAPTPVLAPGRLPDGAPWLGLIGYPDQVHSDRRLLPEVIGGDPGPLLLRRGDGTWESTDPTFRIPTVPGPAAPWSAAWRTPPRRDHRAAVLACQEAIRAGDVYQVNVCTRFDGDLDGDPLDLFADIAAHTSPAKAAYLEGDWGAVASFSPETFLTERDGLLTERPIKGTLPLHQPPERLRASIKDVAENVMIVDLVRNDLSRVAETGTVRTPELLRIEAAPGVWHLVSAVTARRRSDASRADLLDATFPPASVTGTPKLAARERITDWEKHTRGSYCGAIGIDHPSTGLDLNVAIRTVEIRDGHLRLGVGGGITIDSDPDAEWRECLDKASSIVGYPSQEG
ncbi:Para-aminobenzoate synthase, subunit I OS=Tsukamurella paurometabola (strain ATCC 8368 / DSM/ CCUG 35730 / CIP 100753 / JCM 10117 / KCTC 9821 / NBRC 16120/ NCIMB 702349 / NCTC 13040) OX=521096 GN=Tpau_3238 PE=4 SV=1 [Tsukamurella paurometabola]|uniref:Para-aminobenzoate synthase, subunit I n=1 Tax=Tsukamurella paurometabola (strain ATCC 8368 / DSM 20162 / CCUG 35730 / CIP 100753 / JCM 10117 / KCTC 9821 / NBRC 16120 / NCIMB 702349 / NCTC 13040) TaxID=521096 RepID=D5UVP1_TSUPD|nr:aminodeoxychorismate synthase component I [Tsukamurella paurometabola]ADG79823.1 para-aminobenzoate synthase, subunit I [Tsukamurella paurometabola DSM 20162]SUP37340.1 Para-aminobenzoate synthase component 1 [Tsukamurella paurometabola]